MGPGTTRVRDGALGRECGDAAGSGFLSNDWHARMSLARGRLDSAVVLATFAHFFLRLGVDQFMRGQVCLIFCAPTT